MLKIDPRGHIFDLSDENVKFLTKTKKKHDAVKEKLEVLEKIYCEICRKQYAPTEFTILHDPQPKLYGPSEKLVVLEVVN